MGSRPLAFNDVYQDIELSPIHPFTMKFRDELLEKSFNTFKTVRLTTTRRKTGAIVIFIWLFWFIFDYLFAAPEKLFTLFLIRLALFLWGLFVWGMVMAKSFRRLHAIALKHDSFFWGLTALLGACATTLMTCFNGKLTTAGTMLIFFGSNVLLDLPFHTFLIVCTVFPPCYVVIIQYVGYADSSRVLDNIFPIVTTAILAATNSYTKEMHLRHEFRATQMVVDQWKLRAEEALELSRAAQLAAEAKSRFLAVMSHEMRAPLHAIYSMAQLLSQSELAPEDEESVIVIARSSELLLSLINDVLDVSRFDSNSMKLNPDRVDLFDIIEDVTCLCESEVYKREGLEIFPKFTSGIPRYIFADKNRLGQIILNLTWNAVKFCQRGNISIEVSVTDGPLTVPPPFTAYALPQEMGTHLGACLAIAVRDTGVGINPNDIRNVFEEFWQKDTSATRKYNGCGLGLSICKKLTAAMGGQLTVASMPMVPGTCFTLYLPLSTLHIPSTPTFNQPSGVLVGDLDPGLGCTTFLGDVRMFCSESLQLSISAFGSASSNVAGMGVSSNPLKLAIFVNKSHAAVSTLSAHMIGLGFACVYFEKLEDMSGVLAGSMPQLALVFVDANTCHRSPPSVFSIMAPSDMCLCEEFVSAREHEAPFGGRGLSFSSETIPRRPRRHSAFRPSVSFDADSLFNGAAPHPFFPFMFFFVTNTEGRVSPDGLSDKGYSLQLPKPVKISALLRAVSMGIDAATASGRRPSRAQQSSPTRPANDSSRPSPRLPTMPSEPFSTLLVSQRVIRVLVVEDSPVNTRIMQRFLKGTKYSVATAADGLEAIARVDEFDYDVVLMDLHMPNMGGIEATMQIRARTDRKKDIPIIVLSADVLQETLDEALKAGVTDFLPKPVKMEKLFSTIEKFVT